MNITDIVIGAVGIAILVIAFLVYDGIQKRKGHNSEDLKKMEAIAQKLIPNCEQYTIAYSHATTVDPTKLGERTVTTRHYYNIVAFRAGELYVIPITFADKDIAYHKHYLLTKENVGNIEAKDIAYTIFDKDKSMICKLVVHASNTKLDKFDCVNIQQKTQAEAFKSFMAAFQAEGSQARA